MIHTPQQENQLPSDTTWLSRARPREANFHSVSWLSTGVFRAQPLFSTIFNYHQSHHMS